MKECLGQPPDHVVCLHQGLGNSQKVVKSGGKCVGNYLWTQQKDLGPLPKNSEIRKLSLFQIEFCGTKLWPWHGDDHLGV